jgi:hypothetical protein
MCQVCHQINGGKKYEVVNIACQNVDSYIASHPGSCAGPCPCQVTGTQNP